MFTQSTGLIIPTRNRPENLFLTLQYFSKHRIKFYRIVVVDSSNKNLKTNITNICNQFKVDLFFSKPSTSKQRNLGLKKLSQYKLDFIMFLDDDLQFYTNSFKIMDIHIKKNKKKYIGFGFNNTHLKKKKKLLEQIKVSSFIKKLGLYSSKKGLVLDNGWQTKIEDLKKNLESEWLPTSASIFKKNLISCKYFDRSFGTYSYLEDLDYSLQINPKRQKFFSVVANAKFIHLKDVVRTSFFFGYYEFINRFKIVNKFNLKKKKFFFMAICKITITAFSVINNYRNISKLLGNTVALFLLFINSLLNLKR